MAQYLLKRILWGLVTLWGVTLIAFSLVHLIPGDPAVVMAGPAARPEDVAAIRARLKLDQPLPVQYATYVGNLLRGDLGESLYSHAPVSRLIAERLPATAQLALAGWLCWVVLGTLIGIWAASRPTPLREGTLLAFSIVGVSTPSFWLGIMLLYIFVARLNWLPAGGTGTPAQLILPAVTLALGGMAYYARLAHSSMLDTLGEDYIRTATAKGLPFRTVLFRHALRNAALPLLTVAGADLAALLGGVVFTETVFDWKGMGRLAVDSVTSVDIPTILGVVLVSAALVVVANLVVDLLYPLVDPRIRLG